jgi:hypothetical protein
MLTGQAPNPHEALLLRRVTLPTDGRLASGHRRGAGVGSDRLRDRVLTIRANIAEGYDDLEEAHISLKIRLG